MHFIRSTSNPVIKEIVRLHDAKERKRTHRCIIEGIRAITTALQGGLSLKELYCTEEQIVEAQNIAPDTIISCISTAAMSKISTATSPSGLLGIFQIPAQPSFQKLTPGLVLAQIADPGNMGTLIRTAAACGIHSIVIIEGVDPWSPKVVQASAGTVASVQLFQWSWEELLRAKKTCKLYGLVVTGGQHPKTIDPHNALLVVGNEARGIPSSWLKDCDASITIPMPGQTESLNAAIAGSIALYLTFVFK